MVRCNMADECPAKACEHQQLHKEGPACKYMCLTIRNYVRMHGNKRVVCKEVKT